MLYTKDNIKLSPLVFHNYVKREIIQATRIVGEFEVETKEGKLKCEDGYLALDIEGDPYPIAKDVFLKTYAKLSMPPMQKKMPFVLSNQKGRA